MEPAFGAQKIFPATAVQVFVVASLLSASTMSMASPPPTTAGTRFQKPDFHTSSTPPQFSVPNCAQAVSHVDALFDLKSTSGLTWDELSKLFSVSRRSLHHWMNGKRLTPENEATLGRLRAFVLLVGNTDHLQTRDILLSPTMRGKTVYDLLRGGAFDIAAKELSRLPSPIKTKALLVPDPGRPHPMVYLEQADITLSARPDGAVGRRLNINKSKSRS